MLLTPATAVYEYTYRPGLGELGYAEVVQRAEAHCQHYGKHARRVGQPVAEGSDRATVTFDCVSDVGA